jgi:hypothetical protein
MLKRSNCVNEWAEKKTGNRKFMSPICEYIEHLITKDVSERLSPTFTVHLREIVSMLGIQHPALEEVETSKGSLCSQANKSYDLPVRSSLLSF